MGGCGGGARASLAASPTQETSRCPEKKARTTETSEREARHVCHRSKSSQVSPGTPKPAMELPPSNRQHGCVLLDFELHQRSAIQPAGEGVADVDAREFLQHGVIVLADIKERSIWRVAPMRCSIPADWRPRSGHCGMRCCRSSGLAWLQVRVWGHFRVLNGKFCLTCF